MTVHLVGVGIDNDERFFVSIYRKRPDAASIAVKEQVLPVWRPIVCEVLIWRLQSSYSIRRTVRCGNVDIDITLNMEERNALPIKDDVSIASLFLNPPLLQVTAAANPGGQVVILVGQIDQTPELADAASFKLPPRLDPNVEHHKLRVQFEGWRVVNVFLDDQPLECVHRRRPRDRG